MRNALIALVALLARVWRWLKPVPSAKPLTPMDQLQLRVLFFGGSEDNAPDANMRGESLFTTLQREHATTMTTDELIERADELARSTMTPKQYRHLQAAAQQAFAPQVTDMQRIVNDAHRRVWTGRPRIDKSLALNPPPGIDPRLN